MHYRRHQLAKKLFRSLPEIEPGPSADNLLTKLAELTRLLQLFSRQRR